MVGIVHCEPLCITHWCLCAQNLFDDIIPDEDNIIPDDTNEQSTPAVQRPHWHAAGAVKPCRNGNARNQEWRGHATIDLDAVVVSLASSELALRVVWFSKSSGRQVDDVC